jgi:hypothetical protein
VRGERHTRVGYGWLWAGPKPPAGPPTIYSDVLPGETVLPPISDPRGPLATPDFSVIALRILAATAIAGAGFAATRRPRNNQ